MKKETTKRKYLSPFTILASLACIVLACVLLCGHISLNELTISADKKTKECGELVSANEHLEAELERKYSITNIEQIATEELGMVKIQSYQINTVNLADSDSVEITKKEKDNTVFDGIVASFNILLEYLN